jgi:hypothetical protein
MIPTSDALAFVDACGVINSPPHQSRPRFGAAASHAISLKVMSALLLAVMSALVRFLGEKYPVGSSSSARPSLPGLACS